MFHFTAMQDPRHQYPRPPFPRQPQKVPGLDAKMKPKADHGEASSMGHGRLSGRRALITSGNSGIGRAAAIAFACEGADGAIRYLASEEADARHVIELIEAEGRKAVGLAAHPSMFCLPCKSLATSPAKSTR